MRLPAPRDEEFKDLLTRLSANGQSFAAEKWQQYCVSVALHPLRRLHPKLNQQWCNRNVIVMELASAAYCSPDEPTDDTIGPLTCNGRPALEAEDEEQEEEYGGSPLRLQSLVDYRELDAALRSRAACPQATGLGTAASRRAAKRGLPSTDARLLMAAYNRFVLAVGSGLQQSLPLPLWIACDSSEAGSMAYLGMEPACEQGKHGVITYAVTVASASKQDVEEMSAGRIFDRFSWLCDGATSISADVVCRYVIDNHPDQYVLQSEAIVICPSHIILDATWNKAASALQRPPPDAQCTLYLRPVHGDERSPVYHQYMELQQLRALFSYLLSESAAKWPLVTDGRVASTAVTASSSSSSSQIEQLLQADIHFNWTDSNLGGGDARKDDKTGSTGAGLQPASAAQAAASSLFHVEPRQELDFCDKLWNVLKDCTSKEDLFESLDLVERNLRNGSSIPTVYQSAESTVGLWILDLHAGRLRRQAVAGLLDTGSTRPVLLLLELGLDKVRRDYLSTYAAKGLLPVSQLESMLASLVSAEVEPCSAADARSRPVDSAVLASGNASGAYISSAVVARIRRQLRQLEVLHCALESVATLAIHAKLSESVLRAAARVALDFYLHHEGTAAAAAAAERCPTAMAASPVAIGAIPVGSVPAKTDGWLTFPVRTDDVAKLISTLTPEVWSERLRLESSENDWHLLLYSKTPQFDHVQQHQLSDEDSEERYYCLEATTTVTVM